MSTYPPNQTTPKKGSDGYLWNWLGSSLKKFAAALSPYLGGGGDSGVKVYRALVSQFGGNPPTAVVLENTLNATITYSYGAPGAYMIFTSDIFPVDKTFVLLANPGDINMGGTAYVMLSDPAPGGSDQTALPLQSKDYSGNFSDSILLSTSLEILIYP